MARVALRVPSPLPPAACWERLVDARVHTAAVPLTRVRADGGSFGRPGATLVARTALGPVGFDDPMTVDVADGHRLHLRKRGRVVRGWVRATVTPAPDGAPGRAGGRAAGRAAGGSPGPTAGGSVVAWEQEITVAGVPRALDPVVGAVAARAYAAALRAIVTPR